MTKCPKCQALLDIEKISFKEECPSCRTDLHVCIYCRFYDEGKANRCHEPQADYVKERDRANFCEYFHPEERGAEKASGKKAAENMWNKLFRKS